MAQNLGIRTSARLYNSATATATGESIQTGSRETQVIVSLQGSGSATLAIQGFDTGSWVTLETITVSSKSDVEYSKKLTDNLIRANITSISGTIDVELVTGKLLKANEIAYLDAKRYGIVSSTTLDQTSRFQDMADDISAGNAGARTIILPAGEFHITDTITFDEAKQFGSWPTISGTTLGIHGLTIKGQGIGATEIVMDTAGKPAFLFERSASDGTEYNYITTEEFTLIGPGISDTASIGLQFGGGATRSILENTTVKRVYVRNFSTAVAVDDCTNFELSNSQFDGFNYAVEMGFNIDIFSARHCGFGSLTLPQDRSCTITSGSPIVTGLFDMTEDVAVGVTIVADEFPRGTKILTIDSDTQITADQNATGNGSSISFVLGEAISFGAGPFDPAWYTSEVPASNANAHVYQSCWFMKLISPITFADNKNSNHNIKFQESYFERCNRLATIDMPSAGTGPNFLIWDNCHFSQPNNFQDYAIYENLSAAGSGTTVIRNTRSDSNSAVPWVRLDSANSRLDWDNNILNVSTGDKINIFDSNLAYSPLAGDKFVYGLSGLNASPIEQGVTGTIGPTPSSKADCKLKLGPLTGAVTINDVSGSVGNGLVEGQRIMFIFEQDGTGGRNVTWNATYQFNTAWSNTGNTAGTWSSVEFMYDGADFIQISPANTWV